MGKNMTIVMVIAINNESNNILISCITFTDSISIVSSPRASAVFADRFNRFLVLRK